MAARLEPVSVLVEYSSVLVESRLAVTGGLPGRLLFAVATHVASYGVARLGICASDPCRCAYVDQSRGGTRRYCCTLCNDRAAARAYRRRKGETGS
jgi:CGNR zinc finger